MNVSVTERGVFRHGRPGDIEIAVAAASAADTPGSDLGSASLSQQELEWWDKAADVDAKHLKNQIAAGMDKEKRRHGRAVVCVAIAWVLVLFAVLFLDGFSVHGFELPTSVMVSLVAGATATILGALHTITKSLFRE